MSSGSQSTIVSQGENPQPNRVRVRERIQRAAVANPAGEEAVVPLAQRGVGLQRNASGLTHTHESNLSGHASIVQTKPLVQAKLSVNQPNDPYEQEADRVADQVMRMPATLAPPVSPQAQQDPPQAHPFHEQMVQKMKIQRQGQITTPLTPEVTPDIEGRIQRMQSGGSPLPKAERTFFEERMGADFSGVKIHTDSNAIQTSRDLNARAFTVGNTIAFNSGEYQPGTQEGKRLLAHELTHTIQQGVSGDLSKNKTTQSLQRKTNSDLENFAPSQSKAQEHYRIELKAWIPHEKVVDPEEEARWQNIVLEYLMFGAIKGEYHSYYRGDNHAGYDGSYRVLSVVGFAWDGQRITQFTHQGFYGESHRDYEYKVFLKTSWPLPNIPLAKKSGTESDQATKTTTGQSNKNKIFLSIASSNPLVMTWAPEINSELFAQMSMVNNESKLEVLYLTDFFPSHGIRIYKNNQIINTSIVHDANTPPVLGILGGLRILDGLTNHMNLGELENI